MNRVKIGDRVYWYVGDRHCEGEIVEIYQRIAVGGSDEDHALLIEMEDGKRVLKKESEVQYRQTNRFA